MENPTVDRKISILYDNYRDNHFAENAQRDVEAIRRSATVWGAGITTGAFVANEFARLSMRSPLFKLKPLNVAFWFFVPTMMTRRAFDENI